MAKGNNGRLGYKHTPETIEKIRKSNLGWKHTEETKTKMRLNRKGMLGKVHTDTTKLKMSLVSKGKSKTNAHKLALSIAMKKKFENGFISPLEKFRKSNPNFFKGENNPNWIKDRTKLAKRQERNDMAYKEWRKQVWLRDNFKCKIANPDCRGRIEAHHILGWTPHPELRYEINNGITLCHFHHPLKRIEEVKLSPYFQQLVLETVNN